MVTLAIALGLAGSVSPSADLPLGVTVYNRTDIRGPVLARAQLQVTEIFSQLGVRVIWRNGATGRGDDQQAATALTLILLSKPLDGRPDQAGELGMAPGGGTKRGRIAYVFFDRVQNTAMTHRIEVPAILGLAMAHEIGHLLLPYDSHSSDGIMQASWGHAAFQSWRRERLGFTPEQAELIRASITDTSTTR